MSNKPKSGKWKDAFLKSSLPLEYLTANKLHGKHCGVMGEYSYMRKNEQGLDIECSVDLWAVRHYFGQRRDIWGSLNYLVECKYCHSSVRWVFTQHTKSDTEYFFEIGPVGVMDHLCTRMILDKRPLYNLQNRFPMCPKGAEILNNDSSSHNIDRGKSQLIYGLPRLIAHLAETEIMKWNDEDLQVQIFCPMLITTAPLFILKPKLSLESFHKAKDLPDIAEKVPALILTIPYSHIFQDYADSVISSLHNRNPDIKKRLMELGQEKTFPKLSFNFLFDSFIRECAFRVLIVNYDTLEDTINVLHKIILRAAHNLRRVGTLQKDLSKRITWVEPQKKHPNSEATPFNQKSSTP